MATGILQCRNGGNIWGKMCTMAHKAKQVDLVAQLLVMTLVLVAAMVAATHIMQKGSPWRGTGSGGRRDEPYKLSSNELETVRKVVEGALSSFRADALARSRIPGSVEALLAQDQVMSAAEKHNGKSEGINVAASASAEGSGEGLRSGAEGGGSRRSDDVEERGEPYSLAEGKEEEALADVAQRGQGEKVEVEAHEVKDRKGRSKRTKRKKGKKAGVEGKSGNQSEGAQAEGKAITVGTVNEVVQAEGAVINFETLNEGGGGGFLYGWAEPNLAKRLARFGDSSKPARAEGEVAGLQVANVATSGHTLLATTGGELWSFGRDVDKDLQKRGQLGRSGNVDHPGKVEGALAGKFVTAVATGRFHSAATTSEGQVYTWGLNDRGQLGRAGDPLMPVPVGGPMELEKVAMLSAGRYDVTAVTREGHVFTWGLNYYRDGGDSRADDVAFPRRVGGELGGRRVVQVASGYLHWAAITDDGHVYTCLTGSNGYGENLNDVEEWKSVVLGWGPEADQASPFSPRRVAGDLTEERVVGVATARDFTLAFTDDGSLYSWGREKFLAREGDPYLPGRVTFGALANEKVVSISAGEYFAMAATSTGKVYTWGNNGWRQLGREDMALTEDPVPREVTLPETFCSEVVAGFQHALAICRPPSDLQGAGAAPKLAARAAPNGEQKADLTEAPGSGEDRRSDEAGEDSPGEASQGRRALLRLGPERIRQIEEEFPEIFEALGREAFPDAKYRNPCWENATGMYCLPYFQIVGVSKCGTTDLFRRIMEHPHAVEPSNKGPHWWDESREPFSVYLQLFQQPALAIQNNPKVITGEASSNTLTYSGVGVRGLHGAELRHPIVLPELLLRVTPEAKLIVILRNPVDRLYSSFFYYWHYSSSEPATSADFTRHVNENLPIMQACLADQGVRSCARALYHRTQQICKGMYATFLEDWLNIWPRSQMLVFRMEAYHQRTRATLEKVFRFLELDEPTEEVWERMLSKAVQNQQSLRRGPMDADVRKRLQDFYEPLNKELARVVGDDGFLEWNDKKAQGGEASQFR